MTCWLWTLDRNNWGYGRGGPGRSERAAHRLSYVAFVGPIPDDMIVMHRCDTPACVNPGHLSLGTVSDNVQDAISKGRHRSPRGEASPNAKLTKEKVMQARERIASGDTISQVARDTGVSRRAIRFALDGVTWN